MALTLYYHPLSSYCWKALIGLYEKGVSFERVIVDLGDPVSRAPFAALWPIGKMPVLRDEDRGETVAEATIVLDYLDLHYPQPARLVSADADLAWRTRFWDRVFDLHVQDPLQKIVGDRIWPAGQGDAFGVADDRARLAVAYDLIERRLAEQGRLCGDGFGLVDCAAFPALFYADKVQPLGGGHPATSAYLQRLTARPSVARVLEEAAPYFSMFPQG
jgi:glutathione S-transferase